MSAFDLSDIQAIVQRAALPDPPRPKPLSLLAQGLDTQAIASRALRDFIVKDPVQGRKVHADGSISVTRFHPRAPGNVWIRIYRTRQDWFEGRVHATNMESRGCQLWGRPRPGLRDDITVNADGSVYTREYSHDGITIKYYYTAADHDRGRWYSMRSSSEKPKLRNCDFDGDEMNTHV
jgi:hypothetical protein